MTVEERCGLPTINHSVTLAIMAIESPFRARVFAQKVNGPRLRRYLTWHHLARSQGSLYPEET